MFFASHFEATNYKKQTTNEDGLGYLYEDIIVLVASFVVDKLPSTLTRLRHINKNWHNCLNPDQPHINTLWENNICRIIFPHISKDLKVKRWDRYFKYRYLNIPLYIRSSVINRDSTNMKILYSRLKIVEGCKYDVETLKNETNPKLKCPLSISKMTNVGSRYNPEYHCNVCRKDIINANNEKDFIRSINEGNCGSWLSRRPPRPGLGRSMVRGRPYNIEYKHSYDNIDCNNNCDFKSLEAKIKLVDTMENKWTLKPLICIADDINISLETMSTNELNTCYNYWLNQGLSEHASIASFSRFSLDLISLGSPSFLIELVHKATLDEIRHSKIAFDITNLFLQKMEGDDYGKCVNPSKLESHDVMVDGNCKRILKDLINGGCFNELVSALKSIKDSIELKSTQILYSVAMDEVKHCSLAWIAMIWIIDNNNNDIFGVNLNKMYNEKLKGIGDDNEELFAFNIVIPEIIKTLFSGNSKKRDYESMYGEILSTLTSFMELFVRQHQI